MTAEQLAANKRAYYLANQERLQAKQREHYRANAEKRRAYQRAYAARNRDKVNAYSRAYHLRTRDSRRANRAAYNRRQRYGLEAPQFDALVLRSEGRCEACGTRFDVEAAVIDHCHDTGSVRGLLCRPCNQGIGFLGDAEAGVLSALAYLRRA